MTGLVLLVFSLSLHAMPVKDSSTFASRFDGNEIWDSGFQNAWGELNGGGTAEALNGTVFHYDHTGSSAATTLDGTASTVDAGATTWNTDNADDWTLEARIRFREVSNGFAFWCGVDSDRLVVEVYADRTQDSGNNTFNVSHNNEDGAFHVFRIAWDDSANLYHVWRDGVRLTPIAGVNRDSTSDDSRLLFGDTTSGSFGNNYNVDIAYIRYDQTGAYAPPSIGLPASRFNVGFQGHEIWNGTAYTNGWSFSSNPALTLNADNTLTFVNDNQDWLEGQLSSVDDGATTWDTYNHLDWTLEVRMKFNALPEGIAFWLGAGTDRIIVDVFDTYTQDTGGGTFTTAHAANTDGEYHTYRFVNDSEANRYHVWRDNVRLTPVGGVTYDSTNNDDRFIIGDRTSGTFGNAFDITIASVRYNHGAVYTPRTLMLQYGFDFTSGLVTDQNLGIIDDDSGAVHAGQKKWNNPTYAADIPAAGRLKDCTGIGSLDLSTGHHAIWSSPNVITGDDLLAAGGLTMEVWAKQTAAAPSNENSTRGSGTIMTMMDAFSIASQYNKYRVVINSFGNPSPEHTVAETIKLAQGWTHLAAVIRDYSEGATTNGTVELWVNGYLEDSITIDFAPSLDLGRRSGLGSTVYNSGGKFRWDGFVYEPRITLEALDGSNFLWQPPAAGTIFAIR